MDHHKPATSHILENVLLNRNHVGKLLFLNYSNKLIIQLLGNIMRQGENANKDINKKSGFK